MFFNEFLFSLKGYSETLKAKAQKFEERVTVKIIERILQALLKGKIFIVPN